MVGKKRKQTSKNTIINSNLSRLALEKEIKTTAKDKRLHGRLLDFGCGKKPYKAEFVNVTEYIGVEYASRHYKYDSKDVDYYYDGNTLPFENDYFDCIYTSQVLEHIPNLQDILKEFRRVLKKRGYLFITVSFMYGHISAPTDYIRYSSEGIKEQLKQAGFLVVYDKKVNNAAEVVSVFLSNYFKDKFSDNILGVTLFPVLNLIINAIGTGLGKVFSYREAQNRIYSAVVVLARG